MSKDDFFIYGAATCLGALVGGIVIGTGVAIVAGGAAGFATKYAYDKGKEDGKEDALKERAAAELANCKDIINAINRALFNERQNEGLQEKKNHNTY